MCALSTVINRRSTRALLAASVALVVCLPSLAKTTPAAAESSGAFAFGCASDTSWWFSTWLGLGASGSVTEYYNNVCATGIASSSYDETSGTVPVPVPLGESVTAEPPLYNYSETDSFSGSCGVAFVSTSYVGPPESGVLIGGSLFLVPVPLTGSHSAGEVVAVLAPDIEPCFNTIALGAATGIAAGGYANAP